jgi:putative ABC transport system permease protein
VIPRLRMAVARLRGLLTRRAPDPEFDDELRAHLAELTELYITQGMTPGDAAWAARRQFGNSALLEEDRREMRTFPSLENLWHDLLFGARQLRLNPAFTAIAVLSLALGIGANTAIFELVNAVRLRSLPVEKPEDLAYVRFQKGSVRSGNFSTRSSMFTYALWQQIHAEHDSFEDSMAWSATRFNLAPGGEKRWAEGLYVSSNFFRVLGVQPILGRGPEAAGDQPGCASPGAIISYGFWQRQFAGDPDVLQRSVTLDGRPFPVLGVTPPSFFGVEVGNRYDVALPLCADQLMASDGKGRMSDTREWWLSVMGRLRPGWTVERTGVRFRTLSPVIMQAGLPVSYRPEDAKTFLKNKLEVVPGETGVSGLRREYEQPLWLLLATTGLVLLIACANLANLLLARASVRERDMAVRQAIGASRARLIAQLMAESLLLAILGTALGAALARLLSETLIAFLTTSNSGLYLGLGLDGRVLGFTAAIAVGTCVLFGLAPALRATRVAPASAMRAGGRGLTAGRERATLRRALVVAQVALSLVLLVGALLFVGSLRKLLAVDPGFRPQGVVAMDVDFARMHFPKDRRPGVFRELMDHVRSQPGVRAVAQVFFTPLSGNGWNDACWAGGSTGEHQESFFNRVSPGYFQTIGTTLAAGRDFNDRDTLSSPQVAIVNEAFAKRFFGGRNPVGSSFFVEGNSGVPDQRYEIVGLVHNVKYYEIREDFQPISYLPMAQDKDPDSAATFVIQSSLPPGDTIRSAKAAVAEINPAMDVEFTILTRQVEGSLLRDRLMADLAGAFGLLAGVLATLGLYGVIAYMVARRRNEIGIRIALGAGRFEVVRLVLREAAMLVGAGLAIGAGLSLGAGRAAASLLFGLLPNDLVTLASAMALLAFVALLASYGPAHRASGIQPMQTLREE